MDALKELINLSPPVALLVFLFFLAYALKRAGLSPRLIPILQLVLGAVTYPLIAEAAPIGYYYPLPSKIFYGALIGAGTVALHQVIKQWLEKRGIHLNGDTEQITKPKEPNEKTDTNPNGGSGA